MTPEINFALRVTAIAMTVVFSSLIVISFTIGLFKHLKIATAKEENISPVVTKEKESHIQVFSPELIAAISAAVTVVIDKKFQIKKIHYRNAPPESNWNKQGVASIMASHAINKHKGVHHKS